MFLPDILKTARGKLSGVKSKQVKSSCEAFGLPTDPTQPQLLAPGLTYARGSCECEFLRSPPALMGFPFCIAFGDRQTREKGL